MPTPSLDALAALAARQPGAARASPARVPEKARDDPAAPVPTKGRRPKDWGEGDDDSIEAAATRAALAQFGRVPGVKRRT